MMKEQKQISLDLRKSSSAKSEEIDSFLLMLELGYKLCSGLLPCFLFFSLCLHPSRFPYIIYPPFIDLGPPFVDRPGHYLSACPIGHPF